MRACPAEGIPLMHLSGWLLKRTGVVMLAVLGLVQKRSRSRLRHCPRLEPKRCRAAWLALRRQGRRLSLIAAARGWS